MTKTRKIPEHGTPYRYRGAVDGSWPGCRCLPCVTAHTRACKRRALGRLQGTPALHPGGPVLAHIETLVASGMTHGLIARRAGVAQSTISYLTRGISKNLQRQKALAILAVKPGDFDNRAIRPALGYQRRVQALYTLGHNPATIATTAGLDESTISHLANGRYNTIDARTAEAVRDVYQQLLTKPGASVKAKERARQQRWHGPLAWDDIDNPEAEPERLGRRHRARSDRPKTSRTQTPPVDTARVLLLTRQGLTAEQIANTLGCHKRTVVRVRSRARDAQQQLDTAA